MCQDEQGFVPHYIYNLVVLLIIIIIVRIDSCIAHKSDCYTDPCTDPMHIHAWDNSVQKSSIYYATIMSNQTQ